MSLGCRCPAAPDQRYFQIRPAFVEIPCRVQPGESAAGNDYFGLLHFSGGSKGKICSDRPVAVPPERCVVWPTGVATASDRRARREIAAE